MSISLEFLPRFLDGPLSPADPEVVRVTAWTWNRDSHDLFDYEAPQLSCQSFEFSNRAVDLFRKGEEIMSVTHGDEFPVDSEYIGTLFREKLSGNYVLEQGDNHMSKKIWCVVKENWPEGVSLSEGDIVKLGRFKLRVRQICTALCEKDDDTSCSSYSATPSSYCPSKHREFTEAQRLAPDLRVSSRSVISSLSLEDSLKDASIASLQCRICLSEGPSEGDPLVCPCECSGSIRHVHAKCLGHWLRGRLGLENHDGSVYFYRPLSCELCHCPYPSYYRHLSNLHPLAFLPQTVEPFVVFENIGGVQLAPPWNADGSNTFPAGLHVVRFQAPQSLRIGRGHECEMRISDVSISRLHATLRLDENGSVFLQDNKSKFGTLLDSFRLEKRLVIPSNSCVTLQSGRTLLSFSVVGLVGSDQDTVNETDMFDDCVDVFNHDRREQLRPHST